MQNKIDNICGLSPMQQGMLYHYMLHEDSNVYCQQISFKINAELDVELFEKALIQTAKKYDILRTIFIYDKIKSPKQVVLNTINLDFVYKSMEQIEDSKFQQAIKDEKKQLLNKGFKLSQSPAFRITLIKRHSNEFYVIWDFHHIILDGWSLPIIMESSINFYMNIDISAQSNNDKILFSRYINWINQQDKSIVAKKWQDYLSGIEEKTYLNKASGDSEEYEHGCINIKISEEKTAQLKALAVKFKTTLNVVLDVIWGILIQKYNGTDDIILGSVSSGRDIGLDSVSDMVGLLITTTPIRIKCDKETRFNDLLFQINGEFREHMSDGFIGLDNIIKCTDLKGELFDTIIAFENYPLDSISDKRELITEVESREETNYNMAVSISTSKETNMKLSYNSLVYNNKFVLRLGSHIETIIDVILSKEEILVKDIDIITIKEKEQILEAGNNLNVNYPISKTVHEIFEDIVDQYRDKIAIVDQKKEYTYNELNMFANNIAYILTEKKCLRGDIVGLAVEKSFKAIGMILGIIKAGCAYLPIDIKVPVERISFMVSDSNCKLLLCDNNQMSDRLNNLNIAAQIITIEDEDKNLNINNPGNMVEPIDLCYVIYTSGTTGIPKGVMIEHRNVVRLLFNEKMLFDFNAADVWTMFHSYAFDFSVWEMYGALLYGGKLILVDEELARDTPRFLQLLKDQKVSILNQIPTPFYMLMNTELKSINQGLQLRYIIFGGEQLHPGRLKRFHKKYPLIKLINMYGITETTVHVTFKEIGDREIDLDESNIGTPIPTLGMVLLNKDGFMCPIGVPGEICVYGEGVGRGYLNREVLTKEKFVVNHLLANSRIYKSGDIAKLLDSGEFEYLGRGDNQVKVRGFRIELGEIEQSILDISGIHDVAVLSVKQNDGSNLLYAYIVSIEHITVDEIRDILSKRLPAYMIPSFFVMVESIPLTQNGKLDRRKLLENRDVMVDNEIVKAKTANEIKMRAIWSEILELDEEKIGIKDSFFSLGGDSIRVISLVSLINKEFQTHTTIKDIYANSTISEILLLLTNDEQNYEINSKISTELEDFKHRVLQDPIFNDIYKEIEDVYPMSTIEQGMVYHSEIESEKHLYHDQIIYPILDSSFDFYKFRSALQMMVHKHEILRTKFYWDEWKQPIHMITYDKIIDCELIDLSYTNEPIKEVIDYLHEDLKNKLDLKELWKIKVIQTELDKYLIILIMNHAILDGWSVALLMTELINVYHTLKTNGECHVTKLKSSHKDFIKEMLMVREDKRLYDFWKSELVDNVKLIFPPKVNDINAPYNLVRKRLVVEDELRERIYHISNHNKISIRSICLSAYVSMLSMFSYENDFVVGLIDNNRPGCIDGDKILGCFLNTVPFRATMLESETWLAFIKRVQGKTDLLKDYGRLPLIDIMQSIHNDMQKETLFDTVFNFVNFHIYDNVANKSLLDESKIEELCGNAATNTILDVTVDNTGNELIAEFYFDDSKLDSQLVDQLIVYFENSLLCLTEDVNSKLCKEKILGDSEQIKLFELSRANDELQSICVYEMFKMQVERNPQAIAIIFDKRIITYSELSEMVDKVEAFLCYFGIKHNDIVAIYGENSIEVIACILGILKCGATFLPVSNNIPEDRLSYMLNNSCTSLLISSQGLNQKVSCKVVNLDDVFGANNGAFVLDTQSIQAEVSDPAYIIYTSGSTGNPKGVVISNDSIAKTLQWRQAIYQFTPEDTVLITLSHNFDAFITSFFTPLMYGAKVVLAEKIANDVIAIADYIERYKVSQYVTIPTLSELLVKELKIKHDLKLRCITFGGEKLTDKIVSLFKELDSNINIINEYGPTENSVITTLWQSNSGKKLSIGIPKDNTNVYIADSHNHLLGHGAIGEILIGGSGLALGYINDKSLTAQKFLWNPYLNDRIYKSGDYGRWNDEENLEFYGRMDYQVKFHGYRIELEEIERIVMRLNLVSEVVALIQMNKSGDERLCLYYTSTEDVQESEIHSYCENNLPEYMVPDLLVKVDKMPLNNNGKIDRKKLQEFIPTNISAPTEGNVQTARNDLDKIILKIWSDIFKCEIKDINSNFFSLGGQSLKASLFTIKLKNDAGFTLSVKMVFQLKSVRLISDFIGNQSNEKYTQLRSIDLKPFYDVTSQQKAIFLIQNFNKRLTTYNMPVFMQCNERINIDKLEAGVNNVVQENEQLRASFNFVDGKITQCINKKVCFKIERLNAESIDDINLNLLIKPFFLDSAPLFRIAIIELNDKTSILFFDIHHIIADGYSIELFFDKLDRELKGQVQKTFSNTYLDYAEWRNKSVSDMEKTAYWKSRLENINTLHLPYDMENIENLRDFRGKSVTEKFDLDLREKIRSITKSLEITEFSFFTAALQILLSVISNQSDIVIGSTISDRAFESLQNTIGMFVNTFIIRMKVDDKLSVSSFIEKSNENTLSAYENADYPFENLAEMSALRKVNGNAPLFNVMFTMYQTEKEDIILDNIKFKQIIPKNNVSKFDLTFSVVEIRSDLFLEVEYKTSCFHKDSIRKFISLYFELIKQMIITKNTINLNSLKRLLYGADNGGFSFE